MKKILFAILLNFSLIGYSQNISQLHHFSYSIAYSLKAESLAEKSPDSALRNINKAIHYALLSQNKHLTAKTYYQKAKLLDSYAQYDSSFVCYQLAAPLFIASSDSVAAAKCLVNIGVTYYYYGNFDSAYVAYQKADTLLANSNKYILRAKIRNNLALINKSKGVYTSAIKNFHQAMNLYEKAGNYIGIAHSYLNIGVIYWEQKNYNEALESLEYAASILDTTTDFNTLADVYTNIALTYKALQDTVNALTYNNFAYDLYSQTGSKKGCGTVLLNKAVLLDRPGFETEAELLYEQALKIFEELNYSKGIFVCKLNISRYLSSQGQFQKSSQYIKQILDISDQQPVTLIAEAYQLLAKNYAEQQNYKQAHFYLNKYIFAKDSLFSLEKNKQINELLIAYETEKKEQQIALWQKNTQIAELELEKKNKRIRTTTLILFIILIFSAVTSILYIQKRNSYLALVEQNVKHTQAELEKEKKQENSVQNKYADTNLDDERKKILLENLVKIMEKDKVFKNQQFTITNLAKQLETNRNYLSMIINENFKTNFNNFVNEYRIREAKKLLLNPEYSNYTIEGIAQTVGFHSKATFNNAFKKFTGVTPSFFKKNAKLNRK